MKGAKTVWITGASSGIGEALALAYNAKGYRTIISARRSEVLESLQKKLTQPEDSFILPLDLEQHENAEAWFHQASAFTGSIDILVNNAGTNFPEPFLEVSDNHLDTMLDLNVRACFVAAQSAVQVMLRSVDLDEKGACVVNMSSQMGHVGSPNRTVYCMTKHAIEGLTKAMAVELAEKNIRINSIGPTFSETPMVKRIVDTPEKKEFVTSRIPMGRLAKLEDVAAAAVYLASPAASMVTGTHLIVDGGWTAQ